jgi:hypothetical protein
MGWHGERVVGIVAAQRELRQDGRCGFVAFDFAPILGSSTRLHASWGIFARAASRNSGCLGGKDVLKIGAWTLGVISSNPRSTDVMSRVPIASHASLPDGIHKARFMNGLRRSLSKVMSCH